MSNKFPNKNALADVMTKEFGYSTEDAKKAIDCTMDAIKIVVKRDGNVCLQNFGTFKLVQLKARNHRNPQTGEIDVLPPKKKVGFTASKALKEYATK